MQFSTIEIINILLGFSNFVLGFLMFLKARHRADTRFFFVLTICTSLWILGLVTFSNAQRAFIAGFSVHLYYLAAAGIACSLFYFALAFPAEKFKLYLPRDVFVGISSVVIAFISLFPGVLFEEVVLGEQNIVMLRGVYNIYAIYFLGLGICTFYIFIKKFSSSKGLIRLQFSYILAGISLAYIFGTTFNLILPWIGDYTHILIGPIFTVAMVGLFAYAIAKHGLMDIRLIATELFTVLIIFIFLANIFTFNTPRELIFNTIMFVLVTIFGIQLVRGTIREIRALEEISEKKSEFLSIASHQLRTPVTVVKGYLSMLREGSFGKLDEKQLAVINKAYHSNEGMLALINDFLNLSRAEKGTLEYNFLKRDIVRMVDEIVVNLRTAAEAKDVTLNWEKPDEEILVAMDEHKISQVVSNLVDNAIKYTPKGGGVSVRVSKDAGYGKTAKVYVKDNGIGIDKEELEAIFESFQRGNRGKKENVTGSGLGLYVAKMIVEGHNGRIWAESEGEGKGSTFIMELPLKPPKKHEG